MNLQALKTRWMKSSAFRTEHMMSLQDAVLSGNTEALRKYWQRSGAARTMSFDAWKAKQADKLVNTWMVS